MNAESAIRTAKLALDLDFIPILVVGKKPLLPNWQKTSKEKALDKIESYFGKPNSKSWDKTINIGVLTGKPSRVVVIDVDTKDDGVENFTRFVESKKFELDTFTIATGGGGYHYYFQYDDYTNKIGMHPIRKIGDFKTDGGQVVFPGSIHPDTEVEYKIINGCTYDKHGNIESIIIQPMPLELIDLVNNKIKF